MVMASKIPLNVIKRVIIMAQDDYFYQISQINMVSMKLYCIKNNLFCYAPNIHTYVM